MKAYEELSAAAWSSPRNQQQPYGIDSGFRDPSGNSIRLAQRTPMG